MMDLKEEGSRAAEQRLLMKKVRWGERKKRCLGTNKRQSDFPSTTFPIVKRILTPFFSDVTIIQVNK